MHRVTYYALQDLYMISANLWQCDCVLKVGLHFTGIFGEANRWFDRRHMVETSYN
jgi:hypothetical protein